MGKPCKADLQALIDEQQRQIEQYRSEIAKLESCLENQSTARDRHQRQISNMNDSLLTARKERDQALEMSGELKRELNALTNTKSILNDILSRLESASDAPNRRIAELEDQLRQERGKSSCLEQDLRNIQFDIQHNKFLEGKVQAYEAMFRVNPVKAQQGEFEQE